MDFLEQEILLGVPLTNFLLAPFTEGRIAAKAAVKYVLDLDRGKNRSQ